MQMWMRDSEEPTSSDTYDCTAAVTSWEAGWWCCQHRQVGCGSTTSTTTRTSVTTTTKTITKTTTLTTTATTTTTSSTSSSTTSATSATTFTSATGTSMTAT
ncbi:unnamed protein product, partial [Prorocentrum cordatum]